MMIHVLENAGRLRELRAAAGDMAQLADAAGQRLYRWDEESRRPDNGGTVLGSGEKGRWLLCHSGTVELSVFGVTGPQTPMDDALDALVNDPAVRCIRICSDVRMTRRHTFFRSGLTLDLAMALSSAQVKVSSLSARSLPDGHAAVNLVVEVKDLKELNGVINKLNNIQGVYYVARSSGK